MHDITETMKALADENRLRILYALKDKELCACRIIALLELAPSTVSKHLAILRSARLVDCRRDGRWMYYRLAKGFRVPATAQMLGLLFADMESTARIAEDQKRLAMICDEGMESLCQRLFHGS